MKERIQKLARRLGMIPMENIQLVESKATKSGFPHRWWLMGCIGGDQPLPGTENSFSPYDALDAAEQWLRDS
jgi:hypothetical protein